MAVSKCLLFSLSLLDTEHNKIRLRPRVVSLQTSIADSVMLSFSSLSKVYAKVLVQHHISRASIHGLPEAFMIVG